MMTVKVPGIYYVSVMFGVTKKAWYLHLRKNGVYIASVQKDYNAGYEDSLNLHAIGPVPYLIGGQLRLRTEFHIPLGEFRKTLLKRFPLRNWSSYQ